MRSVDTEGRGLLLKRATSRCEFLRENWHYLPPSKRRFAEKLSTGLVAAAN